MPLFDTSWFGALWTDTWAGYLSTAINKATNNKNLTLCQRYRQRNRHHDRRHHGHRHSTLAVWLVWWINGHYIRYVAKQICWLLRHCRRPLHFCCYPVSVCVCVLCASAVVGVACSQSFYCAAVVIAFAFIAVCSLINLWFVVAARNFYVRKIRNYSGFLPSRQTKLVNRFIVEVFSANILNSVTYLSLWSKLTFVIKLKDGFICGFCLRKEKFV